MKIKSFRGQLANGGQDTIVLHTNNGSTGYRIVKLQLFPEKFGVGSAESVVQVYKVSPAAVTGTVNFSDNTVLAVGSWSMHDNAHSNSEDTHVVFDNEIFNQDIYVTHSDLQGGVMNYYIELEQMPLALDENTVATLKDIRNITQ